MSKDIQTCCFTGHRKLPWEDIQNVRKNLYSAILTLITQGVQYFGTGGALGFDTLAAQVILELREVYPHIKLILVLPCKDQTKGWRREDVEIYEEIKKGADKVVILSEKYDRGCMYRRNCHLVTHSGYCICYLTTEKGGTAQTVL